MYVAQPLPVHLEESLPNSAGDMAGNCLQKECSRASRKKQLLKSTSKRSSQTCSFYWPSEHGELAICHCCRVSERCSAFTRAKARVSTRVPTTTPCNGLVAPAKTASRRCIDGRCFCISFLDWESWTEDLGIKTEVQRGRYLCVYFVGIGQLRPTKLRLKRSRHLTRSGLFFRDSLQGRTSALGGQLQC
ncbi:hypothetical protein BD289DRAFT_424814 [Coniella lustricola]|uniref:Uncharacterized protein n=1 Tax=Coniella lustricola TaxID=2025994 RepID=A0A2T3AHT0_9PEZI|nr:hypothetical protein BD289DRAFT_424814 [Coniella lustricola]